MIERKVTKVKESHRVKTALQEREFFGQHKLQRSVETETRSQTNTESFSEHIFANRAENVRKHINAQSVVAVVIYEDSDK